MAALVNNTPTVEGWGREASGKSVFADTDPLSLTSSQSPPEGGPNTSEAVYSAAQNLDTRVQDEIKLSKGKKQTPNRNSGKRTLLKPS
jgi:hypothetical protein